MTPPISSPQNERIKQVRSLQRTKNRRESGLTLLEGPHLLEAALGAGVVPEVVFVAEGEDVGIEAVEVTAVVLDLIAPSESPRGPIAVIHIPEPAPLLAENTLVLWEVADPGNIGTLIRSAAAFGWNVARHGGSDPWSPKSLRSAAGGHFAVSISQVNDLGELSAAGLSMVAAVPAGGLAPGSIEVEGPVALVIGNEASGLPQEIVDAADAMLSIPIQGMESLNAAVAGSIAMYALGG